MEGHNYGNHDEQDEVNQAALFKEQELHVGLGHADDQAGDDCPRERNHAGDDSGDQCPRHGVRAEVGHAGDRAPVSR